MAAFSRDRIYWEAAQIASPTDRQAYLEQACGGDSQLRQDIEILLTVRSQAADFLESPIAVPAATIDEPIREGPGTVIGPYKLLEPIGEGGMGAVWMAEQQEPVRRLVALKVIKAGMDTRQVIARFEAERQALALMDHPHIAKVLDAGTTEGGRPYFVMELVKGVPITTYCDEHRLSPRERLALFVPVCQAIQHAHQKGIIHRDVKPSNVLVASYDGQPVPKVIDFGVAKAIGQRLTERTLVTGFGNLIGTLEYMSPEQAEFNALDVDTRSDIYSLGVLLYELLTGTTPLTRQRLQETALAEVLRTIREEEPPRPSTRLSASKEHLVMISAQRQMGPLQLTRLVRGELDWIVMKALEKDRNRRYDTAGALAGDVQRYLHDEPVQAHPPSLAYRWQKVLRRHRGKALAAAAMLVLLVGGVAASTWQAVRATRAERATGAALAAERTAQRHTRAALDALTDDVVERLLARQPELGDDEKAFLRKVLGYYEAFTQELGETPETQILRAQGSFKVALLRGTLGQRQEAVAGYRRAVALLEPLAANFPDVPEYREKLASSHTNLANQLRVLGQLGEAETSCHRAVALLEPLFAGIPDVPAYREKLAQSCNTLGIVLGSLGKRAEAEAAFRRAVALQEGLAADFPAAYRYRHQLAIWLHNLALLWASVGRQLDKEVEVTYRRALGLHEQVVTEQPAIPAYRLELARSCNGLGNLLRDRGSHADAEPLYRQGLALLERLADEYPAAPAYRFELSDMHDKLLMVLSALGRPEEAEAACRRALALREKLVTEYPASPEYRAKLAVSHNNLAYALTKRGRRTDAEAGYRRALALHEKLVADLPAVPAYRRELARTHRNLGDLFQKQGKYAEAEAAYRPAAEHQQRLADESPEVPVHRQDLANTQLELGHVVRLQGRPAEALPWFDRALARLEALYEQEPRDDYLRRRVRDGHRDRALALGELKRAAEALAAWDRAVDLAAPAERPSLQLERARYRAQLGNVAEAVAEAAATAEDPKAPGGLLYDAACVYALAAAQEERHREVHAGRALALLRRAQAAGLFKDPARVSHLKQDTDFAPLRPRGDFQMLLAELEAAGDKDRP